MFILAQLFRSFNFMGREIPTMLNDKKLFMMLNNLKLQRPLVKIETLRLFIHIEGTVWQRKNKHVHATLRRSFVLSFKT